MTKTYNMEELDCANCAAKMETAISKIEGVNSANISFMTQKITVDIDDNNADKILKEMQRVCKKIEPDCRIIL